jgi:hypothetical protein
MSDEVADAIANGREYIEKNGWWRGNLVGPNGRQACALGGLLLGNGLETNVVLEKHPLVIKAVNRIAGVLEPSLAERYANSQYPIQSLIWSWNDSKNDCKGKQDVLDVFAKAEKIERAGFDPDE